jgi:pyrroloquinoline quinone biosynthesis protein D
MSEETQAFTINPRYRLQWEPAQNCHVLLYPEGLVQLSPTATEILQHCTQPISEQGLVATLQDKYPDADTLPQDVHEFLQQARAREWIKPAAETSGEAQ